MIDVHPQFIKDSAGRKMVVLTETEYESIIEELETIEDIKLYDEVKNEVDNDKMLLTDYIKKRGLNG